MREAARLLEDLSNGHPNHSPFLDVSWPEPHCRFTLFQVSFRSLCL